jgi:hypothetical protein
MNAPSLKPSGSARRARRSFPLEYMPRLAVTYRLPRYGDDVLPDAGRGSAGRYPPPVTRRTPHALGERCQRSKVYIWRGRTRMAVPGFSIEEVSNPDDIARARAQDERHRRNSDWLQTHWAEVLPQARGKFLAVA